MSLRPDRDNLALDIANQVRDTLNDRYDSFKASVTGETAEIYTALAAVADVSDWDSFGFFAASQQTTRFPLVQVYTQAVGADIRDREMRCDYVLPFSLINRQHLGGMFVWAAECVRAALFELDGRGCLQFESESFGGRSRVAQANARFYPIFQMSFNARSLQ